MAKTQKLMAFMSKNKVDIIAITETKLKPSYKNKIKKFKVETKDRKNGLHAAGKVLILIYNSVSYKTQVHYM